MKTALGSGVVWRCSTALGLALTLVGSPAFAADEQSQAEEAGAPSGGGLGEIIVTAQRRSESSQKAAIAITAVGADELLRAGVSDTASLTRVAPALQIGTLAGPQALYYVRGVGNFTANALSDAAVSVNIDGVPIVRSNAVPNLYYDLDRIEVLKGPQGTLYGRNATGGAINLISAKPRLGEVSGYLNGEYGNFDAIKATGALNMPLGDKAAIRVAGIVSDRDGYYTDGTGDDKSQAFRAQLLVEPTDAFRLTVGADYSHMGGKGSGSTAFGLDPDLRIGQSDPRAVTIWQSTFSIPAAAFFEGVPNDQFQDNNFWGVYAQADLTTPVGTLTVIPAYRRSNARYRIHASSVTINERLKDEQTTLEVRLASDDIKRLSYLLGGFYMDENTVERPGFGEQFGNFWARFKTPTKSYAAFGRLTYKVTESFRLTGGLRYTVDDKTADISSYNTIVLCPSFFVNGTPCIGTPILPQTLDIPPELQSIANGPPVPWGTNGAVVTVTNDPASYSKTFKKLTYRLGAEYDVGPQSLLYATFETGFKSGGFFQSIDNPVYRPETIDAFTIGSKNRFLGNRLQLNIEGFWWIYKDQQVNHFKLNSLGNPEFVTENVGKSRVRGIEVEARALVGNGTTLNATVQYLDAKYKNFIYDTPAQNGPPTTGCPAPFDPATGVFVVNCSGRQVINAPKWTINAGIEQAFDFGDGSRLVLNADGRYVSSAYTGFEQLAPMLQKSYATLDLQAQYTLAGGHVSITGFMNNVTDKAAVGFSSPHPFGPSLVALSLRPPRTYGVRVGYTF